MWNRSQAALSAPHPRRTFTAIGLLGLALLAWIASPSLRTSAGTSYPVISADAGRPASPAAPKVESPLCGSPSAHKGCAADGAEEPGEAAPSGAAPAPAASAGKAAPAGEPHEIPAGKTWRIQGDLSEACTCGVPCTCNFGVGPSPHHFCYAVFSLDIQSGRYGDVELDGLHLAAGNAAKGSVWYIDDRATDAQAESLRAIARTIDAKLVAYWKGVDPKIVEDPQFLLLGFKKAKIVQQVGETGNVLQIGDAGRFESDYIVGIDGKTPIVLENNWSWNILHGIKARTRTLVYQDEFGNRIDASSTNANQGRFDWSDRTPLYLR